MFGSLEWIEGMAKVIHEFGLNSKNYEREALRVISLLRFVMAVQIAGYGKLLARLEDTCAHSQRNGDYSLI